MGEAKRKKEKILFKNQKTIRFVYLLKKISKYSQYEIMRFTTNRFNQTKGERYGREKVVQAMPGKK